MLKKLRVPIALFLSVWMILLCFTTGISAETVISDELTDTATETEEPTEGSTEAPAESETQHNEVIDSWYMEEETMGDFSPGQGEPDASVQSSPSQYAQNEQIPDGVYALRHYTNSGLWIDIRYDRTTPGGYVQQYAYSTSPALGTDEQLGLYKITQTEDANRYIVRLMLNQSLTFTIGTDGYMTTKTIPLDDASVPMSDTWYINYYSGGYVFRPALDGTPDLTCIVTQSDTASGAGAGNESRLISGQMHLVGNDCKWILEGRTCHIEDGVYCLENFGNTDRWMDVRYNSINAGGYIQQYAHTCFPTTSGPTANSNRAGLFKITQIGSTGRYVIRLMTNNRLGIYFDGTSVRSKTIPANDYTVPASDTFYIIFYNGVYLLRQYGTNYVVSANATDASGSGGGDASKLIRETLGAFATTSGQSRWMMHKYSGPTFYSHMMIYDSSVDSVGMVVGNMYSIRTVIWSTYINANTPNMAVDAGTSDIADAEWDVNEQVLTVTVNNPGRLQINRSVWHSATGMLTCNHTATVLWVIPQEGIYYIQNAGTERYMDIEGPSTAAGAPIQQWDFSTANQKKWTVEHVSGSAGYVRLKSVYSGLYVGVNAVNTNQIIQTATQDDYTLWRAALTSAGNVKLTCKATNGVLAVPLNENGNGTDLTQVDYTNDTNYRDEWDLYKCIYTYNVNHFFDQGFSARFSNIIPNTTTKINEYQSVVAERFLRIFDIQVVVTYGSFTSSADMCKIQTYGSVTASNCDAECHHSPTHLTTTQLRNDLENGTNTISVAIWTGHLMNANARSNSSSTRHSIVLTPWLTSTLENISDIDRENIFTVCHEESHQLGAHDHYCYGIDSSGKCSNLYCDICVYGRNAPRSCVMSYRYDISTLTDSAMYCSECINTISNHLNGHH